MDAEEQGAKEGGGCGGSLIASLGPSITSPVWRVVTHLT